MVKQIRMKSPKKTPPANVAEARRQLETAVAFAEDGATLSAIRCAKAGIAVLERIHKLREQLLKQAMKAPKKKAAKKAKKA